MKVTYSDKAKQALGESDVAFASATTQDVLSEYPYPPVEANWDTTESPGGRVAFTLRVRDPEGAASRVLEPDEVSSKHDLRYHLYRLMVELLRYRSDKLIGEKLVATGTVAGDR